MTCEMLNMMTLALNNDVELKPNSIANFWRTAKIMVSEGMCADNLDGETRRRLHLAVTQAPETAECGEQQEHRQKSKRTACKRGVPSDRGQGVPVLSVDGDVCKGKDHCRPLFDNAGVKKAIGSWRWYTICSPII